MAKNNFKNTLRNKPQKTGASSGIWIYGKHASLSVLANKNRNIVKILITQSTLQEMADMGKQLNHYPLEIVEGKKLSDILPQSSIHQGIAVLANPLEELEIQEVFTKEKGKCALILDQVTDPQNVGAILRSAAAFNVDAVILPKDNSPPETTALAKAASGALEITPLIKVTNLAAAMNYLKECGFWLLGLDGTADMELSKAPSYDKTALVMGAEGAGLRRLTRDTCDILVKLPISGKMESLNVSNAAAVALYEINRK